jgi:hypothetical protein
MIMFLVTAPAPMSNDPLNSFMKLGYEHHATKALFLKMCSASFLQVICVDPLTV